MKQVSERPATAAPQTAPPPPDAKAGKTRRERALVLGPLFSCLIISVFFPAPGSAGTAFAAMALAASVLWIVVAGLALALDRAIRHPNRICFKHQDQTAGDEVGRDWDTRTGSFAWMEDWEDHQFNDDHHH